MFRPGLAQKPRLWLGWGGSGFVKTWAEPKPPLGAWLRLGLAQAVAFGTQHCFEQLGAKGG